jgi:hypothetical protein
MSSNEYCTTYPFNSSDTYPQLMSDGRALTSYIPSKQYNCQIMKNVAKAQGKEFDPRNYRQVIVGKGKTIEQVHTDCLISKYDKMQKQMATDLKNLETYMWN